MRMCDFEFMYFKISHYFALNFRNLKIEYIIYLYQIKQTGKMQGFKDIIQKEEAEREPLIKDIENTDKDLMESTFGNTSEEDISVDKVVKAKSNKPGM